MAGGIERSGGIICKVRLEAGRIKRSETLRVAGGCVFVCAVKNGKAMLARLQYGFGNIY